MFDLAIIIPAYKGAFLDKALESISAQTCKDFHLYIGDDCSPDNIEQIVRKGCRNIQYSYHRFPSNLGQSNLVGHWERCIDLCEGEPWVWLFGDDDVMEPTCVQSFYESLRAVQHPARLYKFASVVINSAGQVIQSEDNLPFKLTAFDLIINKIKGSIRSYLPDYIFSRERFNEVNRFERFPLAWGVDDVMWVKIIGGDHVQTITQSRICWRLSDLNISNTVNSHGIKKACALLSYSKWLISHFAGHENLRELREMLYTFFIDQVESYKVRFTIGDLIRLAYSSSKLWNTSFQNSAAKLLKLDERYPKNGIKSLLYFKR